MHDRYLVNGASMSIPQLDLQYQSYDRYLITGATGFLGRTLAEQLVRRGAKVYALVLPDDPYIELLPKEVHVVTGDVCVRGSLSHFFTGAGRRSCLIHCAGIVSVASHPGNTLFQVNVVGTRNIMLLCSEYNIGRMIYVSSVHAIPEKPKGNVITEECEFSPMLVNGAYAKSKAAATELAFEAIRLGLRANVVFPSGIIGPGDMVGGSFTAMIKAFLTGKLPLSVKGGYDFVDVRDVARGIIACSESSEVGHGYILSGHYITIDKMLQIVRKTAEAKHRSIPLPVGLAMLAAPHFEKNSLRKDIQPFFTPYSVSVIASNAQFSHAAATESFAYEPRPIEETLRDMTEWLIRQSETGDSMTTD